MQFIRTNQLKTGMRLAKPIYNKLGVLLYDREHELTENAINSISNFGLIGLYILEPAEPAPPISEEELEFERFQTMYMFNLKDELDAIFAEKNTQTLHSLVQTIILRYGHLDHKFAFNQNLRSTDDYTYKHSLNVAILCAMIGSVMRLDNERMESLILAALLHDMGMFRVPAEILEKPRRDYTPEDIAIVNRHFQDANRLLDPQNNPNGFPELALHILAQTTNDFYHPNHPVEFNGKWLPLTRILQVANEYDSLTAMNIGHEPATEVAAIKFLRQFPDYFDPTVVRALTEAIQIVPHASCVLLSNGEKALVLEENPENFMTPIVLIFSTNEVIDLEHQKKGMRLEILDNMKTLDNRISFDEETLRQFHTDANLTRTLFKLNMRRKEKERKAKAKEQ